MYTYRNWESFQTKKKIWNPDSRLQTPDMVSGYVRLYTEQLKLEVCPSEFQNFIIQFLVYFYFDAYWYFEIVFVTICLRKGNRFSFPQ
jgi:hypothetical protein